MDLGFVLLGINTSTKSCSAALMNHASIKKNPFNPLIMILR